MINFYDHRAASYELRGDARGFRVLPSTSDAEHLDPSHEPMPYYWVRERDVKDRVPDWWAREWLLGFKDVTASTNERTFIAAFTPYSGAGNTMPLVFTEHSAHKACCLLANMCSLVLDYVARQKVGGLHLTFFYVQQLPFIPPEQYTEQDLSFIVPRVLELTYTSDSMRPIASDLGYNGPPFGWNTERRAVLRAELDAYYAVLYGLSRDELRYILDPAELYGAEYPSETFRVLREREIREFGEYRTGRLVLAAWDSIVGASIPGEAIA